MLVYSRLGNNVYWQQLERADGTIIPRAPVTRLPAEPFDCVKHFLWPLLPTACGLCSLRAVHSALLKPPLSTAPLGAHERS